MAKKCRGEYLRIQIVNLLPSVLRSGHKVLLSVWICKLFSAGISIEVLHQKE